MTDAFWRGRRTLITGNTGFKGSWLSLWLRELGAKVVGYSLPPPTSPSLFERARLAELFEWTEADVRDLARAKEAFARWKPEVVFHMAAQSLVRASYERPVETFETNITGTVNILEAARVGGVRAVLIVTSDKCYENRDWVWPYRESDQLGGHDPYSTSKACAELVTASYRRSLLGSTGPAVASVRAGNVIGGGDWAQDRLVPDVVAALRSRKPALIRNPYSTRPWQHVLEPLQGYLLLAERLCSQRDFAEAWNFGPNADSVQPVSVIADELCQAWGNGASWTQDLSVHPHEARMLTLDSAKARARLGWTPHLDYRQALRWTVDWHKEVFDGSDPRDQTLHQIRSYQELLI